MTNKKELEKVIEEIEDLKETFLANAKEHKSEEKYDSAVKAITIAHYTLFIALVFKSFELDSQMPLLAKLSLFFFGLGCIAMALRFFADYFAPHSISELKRLVEIEKQYGDELKKKDEEAYDELKILSSSIGRAFSKYDTQKVPSFVFVLIFLALEWASLIVGFLLLVVGVLLLWTSALFT